MNGSAMGTIFEMVQLLISNTVGTLMELGGLFSQLVNQLGVVSITAGTGGLIVSLAVLAVVMFLIGKFVISSAKALIVLFILGLLVLALTLGPNLI